MSISPLLSMLSKNAIKFVIHDFPKHSAMPTIPDFIDFFMYGLEALNTIQNAIQFAGLWAEIPKSEGMLHFFKEALTSLAPVHLVIASHNRIWNRVIGKGACSMVPTEYNQDLNAGNSAWERQSMVHLSFW